MTRGARVCPYHTLGLPSTADKTQVKEQFRKLCLQFHPDKCSPSIAKDVAEARFRDIKGAYDAILRGHAGYNPPPPGTAANAAYARAYYNMHQAAEPGGPVRCGGPYGGFRTEMEFYRNMFRSTKNHPAFLIVAGLVCIPLVSTVVSLVNGRTTFVERYKNEGIFMFTQNRFKINGRETVRTNPFSIRGASGDRENESYIYKSDKFAHLRRANAGTEAEAPAAAAPAQ